MYGLTKLGTLTSFAVRIVRVIAKIIIPKDYTLEEGNRIDRLKLI